MVTLPNATRVFYAVQDWPFALSAGEGRASVFQLGDLESEQRSADTGEWGRTTQLCQPCFQGDLTFRDNAVFRFHSLELTNRSLA